MKSLYFYITIGLVLCFLGGGKAYAQIKFDLGISNKNKKIRVVFHDSSYVSTLTENGTAYISVPSTATPGYARLHRPFGVDYFYIIPGSQQSFKRLSNGEWTYSGAGKDINKYLNGAFLRTLNLDYRKTEVDFIQDWRMLGKRLYAHLDSLNLPENFKVLEHKRLYYVHCNLLLIYPLYHTMLLKCNNFQPAEDYYGTLSKIIKEDPEAMDLWEYRQVYKDWIQRLAEKNVSVPKKTSYDKLTFELHYVRDQIKDKRLVEYLVYTFLTDYIRHNGIEGIDKFLPLFKEKVLTKTYKEDFALLYKQYSQLASGKLAPEFSLKDINGNLVHLSDLRGNYIYIDVWATWCVPCCRELPVLKKMEEAFSGKPISFVSISIDSDIEAWRTKVKSEKLGGIQLHVDKNSSFQKDYKVKLIPHFILIDKEGKIVNEKMTRPSDPKTISTLKELLQ